MTAPGDAQDRADALADQLRAVSEAASRDATEDLRGQIGVLWAGLIARWVILFGSTEDAPPDTVGAIPFVDHARDLIQALRLDPLASQRMEAAVREAYALGGESAAQLAPPVDLIHPLRADRVLPDLEAVLADQQEKALASLDERALVESGFPAVVQTKARLDRAVSRIDATIAHEVTLSANDAVRDHAAAVGWRVVWVAERDACLVCLAYAGVVTDPRIPFPDHLTFGDRPMSAPEPLHGPPRHPHCRCCCQPLSPVDDAIAVGLKREARRSVLRGWADDDSLTVRLRAADRLLARGANLPKTVEARARRAVRDGQFN